jgi:hypothetical protein
MAKLHCALVNLGVMHQINLVNKQLKMPRKSSILGDVRQSLFLRYVGAGLTALQGCSRDPGRAHQGRSELARDNCFAKIRTLRFREQARSHPSRRRAEQSPTSGASGTREGRTNSLCSRNDNGIIHEVSGNWRRDPGLAFAATEPIKVAQTLNGQSPRKMGKASDPKRSELRF